MASTLQAVPPNGPGALAAEAAPPARRAWITDASLLLMAVIWGVNFSVLKYGTASFLPLAFNSVRVFLGTVAITAVALAATRGQPWPSRRVSFTLLGLGVLGNGLYQVLFVEGVARTQAGTASLVLAAGPALIALFGRLRGIERISARGAVGIAASILGVGLVMLGGPAAAARVGAAPDASVLGSVLVFAAAACWAVYTVYLQPHTKSVNGLQLSALTLGGGCVALFVVSVPDLLATTWPASPIAYARDAAAAGGALAGAVGLFANPWGAMAYSGLIAIVAAYLLFYRGVRILGPTRTAMYANLQPAVALFVAWITFGELPSSVQVLGALAILVGIVLTRK
jgi:drug/metabolite transporter (DMT)-like permease